MSGAFGMHRVYWAHRSTTVVNEDGQRRIVYDLRGTHHPSCGWDGAQAVINEADGYAVFQAVTHQDRHTARRKTITVKIFPGDEAPDILQAIEEEAGSFVIRPPKPLNRCNTSSKQNRRNTQ